MSTINNENLEAPNLSVTHLLQVFLLVILASVEKPFLENSIINYKLENLMAGCAVSRVKVHFTL